MPPYMTILPVAASSALNADARALNIIPSRKNRSARNDAQKTTIPTTKGSPLLDVCGRHFVVGHLVGKLECGVKL